MNLTNEELKILSDASRVARQLRAKFVPTTGRWNAMTDDQKKLEEYVHDLRVAIHQITLICPTLPADPDRTD